MRLLYLAGYLAIPVAYAVHLLAQGRTCELGMTFLPATVPRVPPVRVHNHAPLNAN